MKQFILLLVLFACLSQTHADRTVQGNPTGTTTETITGAADGKVTINFGLLNTPPSLIVTASTETDIGVTILASGDLSVAIPSGEGVTALSLAGVAGFAITSSASGAVLTLQLVTPSLTGMFAADTQVVGIFQASDDTYVRIPATFANNALTADLPSVGEYALMIIDLKVTANLGVPRAILAGVNRTYQWGSDFTCEFLSQSANTITVTTSNTTTQGTAEQRATIGQELVFFEITLGTPTASHKSTIKYTYTEARLQAKGIASSAAASLRWAFYDTASAAWTLASSADASVDVNAHVVAQTTNHFSSWGVYSTNSASSVLPCISFLLIFIFVSL